MVPVKIRNLINVGYITKMATVAQIQCLLLFTSFG